MWNKGETGQDYKWQIFYDSGMQAERTWLLVRWMAENLISFFLLPD